MRQLRCDLPTCKKPFVSEHSAQRYCCKQHAKEGSRLKQKLLRQESEVALLDKASAASALKSLLAEGFDDLIANAQFKTAEQLAAQAKDIAFERSIEKALSQGLSKNEIITSLGRQIGDLNSNVHALVTACQNSHLNIVELLKQQAEDRERLKNIDAMLRGDSVPLPTRRHPQAGN